MNINDLARELKAEPYGFAAFCGIPQGSAITEDDAHVFRAEWLAERETLKEYTEALPAIDAMQDEAEMAHDRPEKESVTGTPLLGATRIKTEPLGTEGTVVGWWEDEVE